MPRASRGQISRQASQAGEERLKEAPEGVATGDLTGAVVRWAVKSLYLDEALPRGPLLQWLLQLLLGTKFNHKQLLGLIEAAPGVYADPPDSKRLNFHAVLEDPPLNFKGFITEEDVVNSLTMELWQEAVPWILQGGWPKASDSSHKYYVVASWLQDASEVLNKLSFGHVLGIVKCCAMASGLLGHRGGLLVPYAHSEECERHVNARTGKPTHVNAGEVYVKSWPELQGCLKRLLQESKDGVMEVSKLKSTFRARFSMELSETVFGHQCLSKLLADSRIGEEFTLDTCVGNRYMLQLRRIPGASAESHSSSPSDEQARSPHSQAKVWQI